jgi:uncharacterized repeat protein (TIGR01451 family)
MKNAPHTLLITIITILALLFPTLPAAAQSAGMPAPVASAAPGAPQAGETCTVLQPMPVTGVDAYIKKEKPDERRGTDTELRVKGEANKLKRSLLRFDLSSLPSDAIVSSATLSLYVKGASGGALTINAHRVTQPWNEAQVTWKARDKAAGQLWTTQGGDYDAAVAASTVVDDTKNVWRSWSIGSLVAGWLSSPATNYGLILEAASSNAEKVFKSSDDGTTSQRPKLEVCFSAGLTLTPNNNGEGLAGLTKTYAHVVAVGNLTTAVSLSAASNRGWATRIYQDVNGNGVKDPADTEITQTPVIGPNASYPILVQVDIPIGVPLGMLDTTTVTAVAQTGGKTAAATDITRVGQLLALQPNYTRNAVPGTVQFFGHVVFNNGSTQDCVTLTATSSAGWTVLLWEDLNRNGVHETSSPNEPAVANPVCIDPGKAFYLVAEVRVPAGATAGTVDQTVIRAASGTVPGKQSAATDTTTVIANTPPVVDGKYDPIYNVSPDAQAVCYNDTAGTLFGKLATFYQPTTNAVYMVLAIDKDFVDNTYGVNAIGWPGGHTFGNLDGSDHAQFLGYDDDGDLVLDIKQDYIDAKTGTPSGYDSLGVTGGEGRVNIGNAAHILQWATSEDYNLNSLGYCTGGNCSGGGTNLLVDSPATDEFYSANPTYPNWIYDVIYELKIDKAAFGAAGFGSLEVPYIHASPSKLGTNTIYAEPGVCPGEIGDTVWNDLDHDGVLDAGEPGLAGVQVKLYRDDGDLLFDPAKDTVIGTQTTGANGKYLFQNVPPGDFFAAVVDSTVPAGYIITTNNNPTPVFNLPEGGVYLDADFGYARPWGDYQISKVLTSGNPSVVGEEIAYTIRITNTGATLINFLPLQDLYDPSKLQFISATPAAGSAGNGVITWSDLTAAQSFGRDLGLGQTFEVQVRFRASAATQTTLAAAALLAASAGLNAEPVVDGRLDSNYIYAARYNLPTVDTPANLYKYEGANLCYWALVTDRGFNSNVYADRALDDAYLLLDGWKIKHDFSALLNSDHAIFDITYPGGKYTNLTLDYVAGTPGAWSSGQTGQDQSAAPGTGPVNNVMTSLHGNLLSSGWNGGAWGDPLRHSPPYDYNATSGKYWEWNIIYEFSIPKSKMGNTCGTATLISAHNSPAKGDITSGVIGDTVWADANTNGSKDSGEAGLPGVIVRLYQGSTVVRVTQTEPGNTGYYIFSNLDAGTYVVNVDESTLPANYTLTTNNEPLTVTLPTGGAVLTADFGYWLRATASIGDRVFYDLDGSGLPDGGSEPGINGVKVNLYAGSCAARGGLVGTQTTAGNGGYNFTGLAAGTYCVDVDAATLPSDLALTTANEPLTVSVTNGQAYTTADFGYRAQCPSGTPNVAVTAGVVDETGVTLRTQSGLACVDIRPRPVGDFQISKVLLSGAPATVGAEVIFGIRITNTGEAALSILPLADLYDTTRLQFLAATPATDDTVDDGALNWSDLTAAGASGFGGDLAPGQSVTVQVRFLAKTPTTTRAVGLAAGLGAAAADGRAVASASARAEAPDAAPAWIIEVWPTATCAGWQIVFEGSNSAGEDWRAKVDGTIIAQGNTKGNETVTGAWPATLDLTTAHTFRAEIYEGGSWLARSATFGGCPGSVALPASIGDRVFDDRDGSGLPDGGSEPGINGVTVKLYGGACSAATTVAVDKVSLGTVAGATSFSLAHTTGLGANRLMLVGVSINRETGSTDDRVTSITYAAQPLTRVGVVTDTGTTEARTEIWALVNPPVGTANVVVGFSRANADGAVVGVTTFTGVSQATPYGAFAANRGSGTTLSLTVASAAGELVFDTATLRSQALNAVGAGQTERWRTYFNSRVGAGGSTEPGAASVTMTWTGAASSDWSLAAVSIKPAPSLGGTPISTTVTAGNGNYLFGGLAAGSYCVDVDGTTVPAGYQHTTANDPLTVTVGEGQEYKSADFGYQSPNTASIGDRVFYDLDGSGSPDGGTEPGLVGVTVKLYGAACGTPAAPLVGSQATGANGAYLFTGLAAGAYCVDVDERTLPAGHALTTANEPLTVNLVRDQAFLTADFGYRAACPAGTPNLAVARGVVDETGATLPNRQGVACVDIQARPGAIGDYVWYDADGDGIEDVAEPGIANVTLRLYRDTGNGSFDPLADTLVATTTTDADGGYLFSQLAAGTYFVRVTDANGVLAGLTHIVGGQSQATPTGAIVLGPGQVYKDADFGYYDAPGAGQAQVGDTVWYDANGDGFQQPGEPGIPGVTVVVTDSTGTRLGSDVTDSNGRYLIEAPAGGGYSAGPDMSAPGTAAALAGLTATTAVPAPIPPLAAGQQYLAADFGYRDSVGNLLGTLGNLVFYDTDKSGAYTGGDWPLGGVSVDLIRDANGNGTWDAGEPIIATVTTSTTVGANTGNYLFTGVPGGKYLAHVSDTNAVLNDYERGPLGSAGVDGNSQADPYAITLPAGGSNLTADFGYVRAARPDLGVIGNQVWLERDGNGLFAPADGDLGVAGITVALLQGGAVIATTTTGASGDYSFTGLPAETYAVTVTDVFNVMLGYDLTALGPQPGQDNNHQAQPYTVVLPADGVNLTADFGYITGSGGQQAAPNYRITKALNGLREVRPGSEISFTIRIINTGDSPIIYLPLRDMYDADYLTYGFGGHFATPDSDDHVSDGVINWANVLDPARGGIGTLPVNGSVVIVVYFTARADTTALPLGKTINVATVTGAWAKTGVIGPNGTDLVELPPKSAQDNVGVVNPTGLHVTGLRVAAGAGGAVVEWATANEANVLGFRVLRRLADAAAYEVITPEVIVAEQAGTNQGGNYRYMDVGAPAGAWEYALAVLLLDGRIEQIGPSQMTRVP